MTEELTLRKLRETHCKLTQQEMAKRLRMSYVGYGYIERRRNMGTIRAWLKIQKVYGLDDATLVAMLKRQVRWKG